MVDEEKQYQPIIFVDLFDETKTACFICGVSGALKATRCRKNKHAISAVWKHTLVKHVNNNNTIIMNSSLSMVMVTGGGKSTHILYSS